MTARPAIRKARPEDLAPLARLWHDAWHEAHGHLVPPELVDLRTLDDFRARLPALQPMIRTAGPVGAPLGFCATRADEMYQLFLAPDARGTGLAALLLSDAEARIAANGASVAWLDIAIGNDRAERFYIRQGWAIARTETVQLDTATGTFPLHAKVLTKRVTA
ncbi:MULTISPECIES: GNAT family N-acetyltransferase [Paracoccaceae]|uniref:GNAT family N-acetyltransferase n=1 Tax=Rhodobacterales TaxID=204455 RepID=UPI001D0BAC1D|nr:GNAT family N-acetyltransferase [Boseongicola sp. H5]